MRTNPLPRLGEGIYTPRGTGHVEGLALKLFTNEHNCVACNKGKQHKASYKASSAVRTIFEPLQLVHMDLFGHTSIRSIDHKYYSLVVTDDFSRCDNGAEFQNAKLIDLCRKKELEGTIVMPELHNKIGKKVEETLNLRYLEDIPNIQGLGQERSIDSAGFGDPAASESVPAVFNPDHAANSTLPLGHSLGSSEHSTRFPSPSNLGNNQPTAGIFSSSSYDDEFYADVTNLASSVGVDPIATKRVHIIHLQSQIIRELLSPGFEDPHNPKHVYRVVKALYGLHQVPSAWYARLSTFVLKHHYRRGTTDKTLFLKKDSRHIILVQVYMDDIIFGST
nr:retrovirus-related Pol polyprotein from transposon TNT 1-94 [Tanacetum cinerariifolium]